MEETFENENLSLKDSLVKKTYNAIKSNKCNQCDFASIQAGDLRRHLIIHSGEKSHNCNQCDFACSDPSTLREHLKIHSKKCIQCDFTCF